MFLSVLIIFHFSDCSFMVFACLCSINRRAISSLKILDDGSTDARDEQWPGDEYSRREGLHYV